MMPFDDDVVAVASAVTKREHAHRTRLLVAVMTLLVLLAITLAILPTTFQSPISRKSSSSSNSIESDYRLLGVRDLCRKDECPDDPDKKQPGTCGCDEIDDDTDADGDGIADCVDECVANDEEIMSFCQEEIPGYTKCEGCAEQYLNAQWVCGEQCSKTIKWCMTVIEDYSVSYDEELGFNLIKIHYSFNQSGADSSNTIWEWSEECDAAWNCKDGAYEYLNGVQCNYTTSGNTGECLTCVDGKSYCYKKGDAPLSTDVMYTYGNNEGSTMYDVCFPEGD